MNKIIKNARAFFTVFLCSLVISLFVYPHASLSYEQQPIAVLTDIILDGNDAPIEEDVVTFHARTLKLQNGYILKAQEVYANIEALEIEEGSGISASEGVYVVTPYINNKGVIDGFLFLDFKGNPENGVKIGRVNGLLYRGPLPEHFADVLVQGSNEIVDIASAGAVLIDTPSSVHFAQEHVINHALCVKSGEKIQADKNIRSPYAIQFDAQKNIDHKSLNSDALVFLKGGDITAFSEVERECEGQNYRDICSEVKVSAQRVVIIAEKDIAYSLVTVQSGSEGTHLYVGGNLLSDVVVAQDYTKEEEYISRWVFKNVTTTTEEKNIKALPSVFASDGKTAIAINGSAELHGTVFNSLGGSTIEAGKGIVEVLEKNICAVVTTVKQGGFNKKNSHTQSIISEEKPIQCNDEQETVFKSSDPMTLHVSGTSPSISINTPELTCATAHTTTDSETDKDATYVFLWNNAYHIDDHTVAYHIPYQGQITTDASVIHVHDVANAAQLKINALCKDALIDRVVLEHIYESQKITLYNRPTQLAINLIALSLSVATFHVGSALGAGIVSAMHIEAAWAAAMVSQATSGALHGLCMEAITALVNSDGDMHKAVNLFAQTSTIKNIALSACASSSMVGIQYGLSALGMPRFDQAESLCESLVCAAPSQLLRAGVLCATDVARGADFFESAQSRMLIAGANIVGIGCSHQIGGAYGNGDIGPITHKVLHTATGAIEGAIVGGQNGAIIGAVSAGLSEIITDCSAPKPPSLESIEKIEMERGRPLTQEEFIVEWDLQLEEYFKQSYSLADASKIITTTVAALTNQDMDIAYNTASNAIDNNFLVLACYAATAANVAYASYSVYKTYKHKGTEAALNELGIKLIYDAGQHVIGCGMRRALVMFAGKVYPSVTCAVKAALDSSPGLKKALGGWADSFVVTAEKFVESSAGKRVLEAYQYAKSLETKIVNIENKTFEKAKYYAIKSGQNFAEYAVPQRTWEKIEDQVCQKSAQAFRPPINLSLYQTLSLEPRVDGVPKVKKISYSYLTRDIIFITWVGEYLRSLDRDLEYLMKKFYQIEKIKGKWLKFPFKHFFGLDISFCKKGKLTIGGFHHDLYDRVQKSGILEFRNKKPIGDDGFWQADIFYKGVKVKNVTCFPSHWSREKVVDSIFEGYRDFLKSGKALPELDKGKYPLEIFIGKIKIKMHITTNGVIKTVYPVSDE